MHLAEHCRAEYSRLPNFILWVIAEIAVVACDIPEGITVAHIIIMVFSFWSYLAAKDAFEIYNGHNKIREVIYWKLIPLYNQFFLPKTCISLWNNENNHRLYIGEVFKVSLLIK